MVNQARQMQRPPPHQVVGIWPPPRKVPLGGIREGVVKKKVSIPTWLIIVIIVAFLGIAGLVWWLV